MFGLASRRGGSTVGWVPLRKPTTRWLQAKPLPRETPTDLAEHEECLRKETAEVLKSGPEKNNE